jgi:hypothetical protein
VRIGNSIARARFWSCGWGGSSGDFRRQWAAPGACRHTSARAPRVVATQAPVASSTGGFRGGRERREVAGKRLFVDALAGKAATNYTLGHATRSLGTGRSDRRVESSPSQYQRICSRARLEWLRRICVPRFGTASFRSSYARTGARASTIVRPP